MKKKANLSLIFAIIAITLSLGMTLISVFVSGAPLSVLVVAVPEIVTAFIVPVFVIIGRRAPKTKKPLAVVTFVILGIQILAAIATLVIYILRISNGMYFARVLESRLSIINGAQVFYFLYPLSLGFGSMPWSIMLGFLPSSVVEILYILKNVFGAADLCRKNATIPAQAYAPQYNAQPQYAAPAYIQQPAQPAPKEAYSSNFCPNCGTPAAGSGVFCGKCGSRISG